jgi:hypothetical protein
MRSERMRERSDTWHEMRRIHKGLSNMTDCKHNGIERGNQHIHFCVECGVTICQVTGAIRDMHGKVIGNITTPEWEPPEPPPPLQEAIALLDRELEIAKDADDCTEDLERVLVILNMLRRKEKASSVRTDLANAMVTVFTRLNVLAKGELDKARELLDMVKESAPHTRIDRDLDMLYGLTRKAHLRQKVGHAYIWAIQDIKTALGLPVSDADFTKALKNHPTELDQ